MTQLACIFRQFKTSQASPVLASREDGNPRARILCRRTRSRDRSCGGNPSGLHPHGATPSDGSPSTPRAGPRRARMRNQPRQSRRGPAGPDAGSSASGRGGHDQSRRGARRRCTFARRSTPSRRAPLECNAAGESRGSDLEAHPRSRPRHHRMCRAAELATKMLHGPAGKSRCTCKFIAARVHSSGHRRLARARGPSRARREQAVKRTVRVKRAPIPAD